MPVPYHRLVQRDAVAVSIFPRLTAAIFELIWKHRHQLRDCAYFSVVRGLCSKQFIIINRETESYEEDQYMIIGAMKDKIPKLRGVHSSHTLGCSGDWKAQDRDKINGR